MTDGYEVSTIGEAYQDGELIGSAIVMDSTNEPEFDEVIELRKKAHGPYFAARWLIKKQQDKIISLIIQNLA